MKELEKTIIRVFHEALESTDSELIGEITEDMILLESGLDSLGFAVLVALLEEELEYDPFALMEDAVYPKSFKQFIDIYEKYQPNK